MGPKCWWKFALLIMAISSSFGASKSPYETDEMPVMMRTNKEHHNKRRSLQGSKLYTADWESLDTRPLPSWYDDSKFGIFIHWGVYSVPSFGSEWFWVKWLGEKNQSYIDFMKKNYAPGFSYPEFAPMFTAEFFNPSEWVDIFKSSGAKYVVLTSKHHEGFTLWPSKYSFNWNSKDIGPKRDLVGELASAIRNSTNMKFGLYYSLLEWFHPVYMEDRANNWTTQEYVKSKMLPELRDIVNKYKPSVIWSDGDWEPPSAQYWNATEYIAWLYNESPVKDEVVVNDRWGVGTTCQHGDFFTCTDGYSPGTLQPHKWENCFTIDKKSWGYRRNTVISDYHSTASLIKELVKTVSCGGNMLLNVGPTHYGSIAPVFEERLRQIGQWLNINGEAIYSSRPWIYQNDTITSNVWYTKGKATAQQSDPVYAIVLTWPQSGVINLGSPTANGLTSVSLLGYAGAIQWVATTPGIRVTLPSKTNVSTEWAWVFRLDNLIY